MHNSEMDGSEINDWTTRRLTDTGPLRSEEMDDSEIDDSEIDNTGPRANRAPTSIFRQFYGDFAQFLISF